MIKILLIGSGELTAGILDALQKHGDFNIIGIILDNLASENCNHSIIKKAKEQRINILSITDIEEIDIDLVFVNEYRKIINYKFKNETKVLNLHAGVLPYYRGFHSNAWAILNSEEHIGYSIHALIDKFDAGDIYYIRKFSVKGNLTYSDVKPIMLKDIIDNISAFLLNIYQNNIKPIKQDHTLSNYCTKLRASDGDVSGFNFTSQHIINLYKCMSKPLGSGMYFVKNNKKYIIEKIGFDIYPNKYIGINGAITNIEINGSMFVKTNDTNVLIKEISVDNIKMKPGSVFRIGQRI